MIYQLIYGTTIIKYQLTFSNRKSLGVKVHPDKSVHVIAPIGTEMLKINEKLKTKASWILKQQAFFLSFYPLTPERKFVSGETHLYLGKQYRLKLIEGDMESVKMKSGYLFITLKEISNTARIEFLLRSWYAKKAVFHFESLFKKNLKIATSISDIIPSLKYRWMDKRWGSCDAKGIIHLNLELIKSPKVCIEYVLLHEICHLRYLDHGNAFVQLLNTLCPDWKLTKDRLEKMMV
ncbi:M48 family metallopeptidase [Tenacibaculum finnmarkense]|uniref:M48 family metallopeptidase n=1 Tax=Tenacibaculum finnmarkense TaxID=2781243 RepID=UPI00187B70A2|nr:SprT family zinc-dependent metalloprotease [Tenacibaculum finnmarkense]MBE7649013.1 DUF45 domain-containing protein [Tenacibaculum finnmarkense genomovar ulcerans]